MSANQSTARKIGKREFSKLRDAYEKEFEKELRVLVRGSGWRKSRESLVRASDGLFFESSILISSAENKSFFRFSHKPMVLDEIFWDVFLMPENKEQPLSFRAHGAFTCSGQSSEQLVVDDTELTSAELARLYFEFAQDQSNACGIEYSLENFIAYHEALLNKAQFFKCSATLFCAYCAANDKARAKTYAQECLQHPEFVSSGFSGGDAGKKDFLEFGLEYLGEKKVMKSSWKFWE